MMNYTCSYIVLIDMLAITYTSYVLSLETAISSFQQHSCHKTQPNCRVAYTERYLGVEIRIKSYVKNDTLNFIF